MNPGGGEENEALVRAPRILPQYPILPPFLIILPFSFCVPEDTHQPKSHLSGLNTLPVCKFGGVCMFGQDPFQRLVI